MRKAIGIISIALLVGACYFALWPRQLGGPVSYVVTSGNSMEPDLHEGDLVIVRASDSYEVGDVVAYMNGSLGSPVLHRIIGVDSGSYVLQGDNNDFIDSYRPGKTEILGRSWVAIPGGGSVLRTVASPEVATAIAVLLGLSIPGSLALRRRRRSPDAPPPTLGVTDEVVPPTVLYRRALVPLTIVAAVAAAAAGLSFGRSLETRVSEDVAYSHEGRFTYSGRATKSDAIYEDRRVGTGDPIYKGAVEGLRVGFSYSLEGSPRSDVTGTQALEARVSSADGWNRTVELVPPTPFEGPASAVQADLDIDALTAMTIRMEQQTGFDPGLYTVDIVSPVVLEGTLDGASLSDGFDPALSFTMDDLKLQLAAGVPESGPPGAVEEAEGVATRVRDVPASVSVLGLDLPVDAVRSVSAWVLVLVAALGILLLAGFVRASRRESEGESILARFPDRFVPVRSFDDLSGLPSVELTSIDHLIRMADAGEKLILYVPALPLRTFVLEQGGVVYHYTTAEFRSEADVETELDDLRIEVVQATEMESESDPLARWDDTVDAR